MRTAPPSARMLVCIASAFAAGASFADDIDWVGYQNGFMNIYPDVGSFFHGDNWLNYTPPGPEDIARFGLPHDMPNGNKSHNPHHIHFGNFNCYTPGNGPNVISGGDAAVKHLLIYDQGFVFDFSSGTTPGGNMPAPLTGSLSIANGLEVGLDTHDGELTIINGPVTSNYLVVAVGGGPTIGRLTVSGSEASLDLASTGDSNIGQRAGNKASMTIEDGAAFTMGGNNYGNLIVGREGSTGELVLTGGATLDTGTHPILVGSGTNQGVRGSGSMVVSAGASAVLGRFITVGHNDASGTLDISDGGTVTAVEGTRVGDLPGAEGFMSVTGPGSVWSGGPLAVGTGGGGYGSLEVTGGGLVASDWLQVGREGHGTVVVSGKGSKVMRVGVAITNKATGSFTVEKGAEASNLNNDGSRGTALIGEGFDSVGYATVTGPGSSWTGIGHLVVSGVSHTDTNGEGHLTIEDGGVVDCDVAFISAQQTMTHGFVTVRGEESLMVAQFEIFLATTGTGELTLAEGGRAKAQRLECGPGSTFRVGVGPLGAGTVEASGSVKLDGALELVPEGKLVPGDSFVIATGAQVSGEFDSITPDDFGVTIHGGVVSAVYKPCYADMDGSDGFNLFDFLAFVNLFNAQDPEADCTGDGAFDLFDFLCFNNFFNAGC